MTTKRSGIKWQLCVGLAALLSMSASAITIYSNSSNDLAFRFTAGTLEIGDEINLAGGARFLTNFSFQYYGTNRFAAGNPPFAGTIMAQIRFYTMGLPLFNGFPTPSGLFYTSPVFPIGGPTPRSTFTFSSAGGDFPAAGLFIPTSDMTWSVQFSGMGGFDDVGVDIFSPPTVGSSLNDYWENSGGWKLKTNVVNMNFASVFQATPEPSSVALFVLGGLGLLYASRRSRKH